MSIQPITPDQSTADLESRRKLALALSIAARQAMAQPSLDGQHAPDDTPEDSTAAPAAFNLPSQPSQPSQRVLDLGKQADAIPATGIEQPTNWKQALVNAATKILPVALTARFAGTAAGAGAGQGEVNASQQLAADQLNRRNQLLQEAQQESTEDQREREFNLEDQIRQGQLQNEAERAKDQAENQRTEFSERQREFNLGRQDKLDAQTTAAQREKQDDARTLAVAGLMRDADGNIVPLPKSSLPLVRQKEIDKPSTESGTYSLAEDGNGNPVLFNSKTGQTKPAPNGLHKPNAEEVKRGDLSENVNENLDALEEIVKRRPELFGPIGGRETAVRQFIGSNDPDVGRLQMIKDNLGKALQSAHGMRNAMAVEQTGNAVLNNFKNGPTAILGAIGDARRSVGTFLKDVQQGNPAVTGNSSRTSQPPRPPNVPANYVYNKNGPKGPGWYRP